MPPARPASAAAPPRVTAAVDPGPSPLRRLTNVEYLNTVRDLLGTSASVIRGIALATESDATHGFDTNVELQALTPDHLRAYAEAARRLAGDVFSSTTRALALVGCDPARDGGCVRAFAERFGRRAYRRPLRAEELASLTKLAASEASPTEGAALVLRAVLQAPSFLFREESGVPAAERPPWQRLTGLEIATRLSYGLLRTTPSDALLDAAQGGELDTADGVERAARRLLGDPRARETARSFLAQWLELDHLGSVVRSRTRYPSWSEALRASMREETLRFVEELAWGEGRDFRSLVDARFSFVDAGLARVYGLPVPATAWARIDFPPDLPRAGIVTHASLLTMTGHDDGTSAIFRGKFLLTRLLCGELPVPPNEVPEIDRIDLDLPERERLEQHRRDPACSGCHQLIDPLGFGLARYDAIGAYRATDTRGRAIPEDGALVEGETFTGGVELAARLRNEPKAASCPARQVARYLLGRGAVPGDDALVERMHDAYAKAGGGFKEALVAYTTSDAFRYRR